MNVRPIFLALLTLLVAACTAPLQPNPTPDPVALGRDVFARIYAQCHGAQAEGYAYPLAPPLNGSAHTWHHPDAQLRDWIQNGKLGVAQMPPYGDQLTAAEIDAVIVYIKSLWPEQQRAIQKEINRRFPTPAP